MMITESGRVVGIEEDALWVETVRRSTCGSCAAQKGCGQGLMNKATDGRRNQLRVLLGSQPSSMFELDEEVGISIPERALISGALVVYLLPLLSMIAGMGLASNYGSGDGVAAIGALLGFMAGAALVRLHASYIRNNPAFQATVIAKDRPSVIDCSLVNASPHSE
ncbi:Protein RseC [Zhongshania aliphaticivorans]|uniref:Protein RseC n=1 Tax=Zhongshania aliphaticivorans TaxID=1470434 RepID=A0A5S9QAL3_9GAMM|nr:SoxR reducing system RseC family protein [Zhongshania aliphaticivorans]CAA0087339.1 Protein RseC [Zhongshania aliphaticivorans]CAA0114581.1 Protein RseC [Zhongshania aliphaticivorans]